jgi:hypothetical protein
MVVPGLSQSTSLVPIPVSAQTLDQKRSPSGYYIQRAIDLPQTLQCFSRVGYCVWISLLPHAFPVQPIRLAIKAIWIPVWTNLLRVNFLDMLLLYLVRNSIIYIARSLGRY